MDFIKLKAPLTHTCQHKIRLARPYPNGQEPFSIKQRKRRGQELDVCYQKATHLVEGVYTCTSHASQLALKVLETPQLT